MKIGNYFVMGLFMLALSVSVLPAETKATIICGQVITQDTTLDADLECPSDTLFAINIGASDITLDLGGHTVSGYAPGTGVLATDRVGISIKNGVIEGFNDGIFLINTQDVTIENLTVRNLNIFDPDHLIMGLHIGDSQNVVVRDILFEFLSVAHKEAIDIFNSAVAVSNIEVRGGGVGVNFSFDNGVCNPIDRPSNGTVLNSRFSNIYIAGVLIACSRSAWIEGNDFSGAPGAGIGIQGDAPFSGDVTGVTIKGNFIHDAVIGIEFRGILDSNVSNNYVFDNQIWGVAMRQSLGCLTPEIGWECFYSTANVIAGNETWGNVVDLYHYVDSTGNNWTGNTCETREGLEIPECTPPKATLVTNYASGKPGSFFTLRGANFPTNGMATISINGNLLGSVPTDSSGELVFLLNTDEADEGDYVVTATVNPSSSARFVLDPSRSLRLQEGSGTIFNVPGGLTTRTIFLPLVHR